MTNAVSWLLPAVVFSAVGVIAARAFTRRRKTWKPAPSSIAFQYEPPRRIDVVAIDDGSVESRPEGKS